MTIQYHESGDYYLPNLVLEDTEVQPIGKYGRMRKRYLKEHRPGLYSTMRWRESCFSILRKSKKPARNG